MERLYAICFFILSVVEVRIVAADEECFQLGEFNLYTGHKNTTQSGLECQRWDKQTPHEHKYTADKFPEQSLCKAKNYCRDPGGDGFTWCYTTDPETRWEACGIPWCDEPARNYKIHDCYILTEEDRQHGNTKQEMCESNFNRESVCGNDVPKGCETCDACCQKRDYCCESIHGYNGTWHRTESGRECQRWDEQSPHTHDQTADYKFTADSSVTAAQNYCRDPDNSGFLWCYSMDPNVRWEKCGIPEC